MFAEIPHQLLGSALNCLSYYYFIIFDIIQGSYAPWSSGLMQYRQYYDYQITTIVCHHDYFPLASIDSAKFPAYAGMKEKFAG